MSKKNTETKKYVTKHKKNMPAEAALKSSPSMTFETQNKNRKKLYIDATPAVPPIE
ncbi:hypothetical protein GCM10007854_23060 [Algimonas porphyrae]|uniref:Uncharacterized protein n=1 Tax=Algimonas porphyrae TaxID=1128113 RepID=A0ABQ5V438_9PROT|nr:hypothetical protein GCM10007854_23060 [Algimonas porphyrae]